MSHTSPPAEPRTIVLFGIPFHDVSMAETLGWIDHFIATRKPSYLVTANLDFAAQASEDVELQRILVEAELVLCDGTPLVWASHLTGKPLRERVAGSDLVPRLAAHAEKMGYRVFLLGGDPDSLRRGAARLQQDHPRLPAAGFYSPPFAPLHEFDNRPIIDAIREARPEILLVAFGCPKQEKWIYMHYRALGVPCCIGVGATIDFLAGKVSRAPAWMARFGLEWVFRLLQEPRRLIGRYAKDIAFLVTQSLRESRAIRKTVAAGDLPDVSLEPTSDVEYVRWEGSLTAARVEGFAQPDFTRPFVIDLSSVTTVDSRGLGTMLRVVRRAWAQGTPGCFLAPSEAVRKVVEVTRLERILPLAETMDEATRILARDGASTALRPVAGEAAGVLLFRLPARLTAENAESVALAVRSAWDDRPDSRELVFDMGETHFMDSSGLGFLLLCHRLAVQRPNGRLRLSHLRENIRNVIRVSKLENVLLAAES